MHLDVFIAHFYQLHGLCLDETFKANINVYLRNRHIFSVQSHHEEVTEMFINSNRNQMQLRRVHTITAWLF